MKRKDKQKLYVRDRNKTWHSSEQECYLYEVENESYIQTRKTLGNRINTL